MHTVTLDSGACDHVCSDASLRVPTVPGEKSPRGVAYEVANGDEIAQFGEKKCVITTGEATVPTPLTMQVCDVHKSRLSIGKMVKAGKRVVFDSESSGGAYIECKASGEKLPLRPDGNLWTLKA